MRKYIIDKEFLTKKYVEEGKTLYEIAQMIGTQSKQ